MSITLDHDVKENCSISIKTKSKMFTYEKKQKIHSLVKRFPSHKGFKFVIILF